MSYYTVCTIISVLSDMFCVMYLQDNILMASIGDKFSNLKLIFLLGKEVISNTISGIWKTVLNKKRKRKQEDFTYLKIFK